ncbi:phospholipase D family protein [Roseiconus lacunae]|uniref:phospholipase D family protein n=1 Tax=Roseiconus lacunae TaxID=2605694 RepID=UPI001E40BCAD|nr:phospholipase D family protein [Roseiconus lacunae]MCD0459557.1 phospholipase D family protein [Roseiconus lacunae]
MHELTLATQDGQIGLTSKILDAISSMSAAREFTRLRVAVAYATVGGCKDLFNELNRECSHWGNIEKEWLVSIDFGTTDPNALQFLRDHSKSSIRVPNGQHVLARKLKPTQCFHPKTYWFQEGDDESGLGLGVFSGSANLTFSGLRHGTEHGVSTLWVPPHGEVDEKHRTSTLASLGWWEPTWDSATEVTDAFLNQYKTTRPPKVRTDDDDDVAQQFIDADEVSVEPRAGVAWATARCFWTQTFKIVENLGGGRPGNQVDCVRGARVFFGFSARNVPKNTVLGDIEMRYVGKGQVTTSVRYGNNSMDKVNLPIPDTDGPPEYAQRWLHFERKEDHFELTVVDSAGAEDWRNRSKEQGMYYKTKGGGREFGFYS